MLKHFSGGGVNKGYNVDGNATVENCDDGTGRFICLSSIDTISYEYIFFIYKMFLEFIL